MIAIIKHYLIRCSGRSLGILDTATGDEHAILVHCYGAGTDFAEFTQRPSLRVSMGTFPDGLRVFYVFDPADDCFGFAFNIDAPDLSEWGYAPYRDWDLEMAA